MRHIRLPAATILIFLAIEFLDELVDGVGSAAWPLVRTDLDLTYVQIGLLLSVPGIFSTFVEPFIGILGDIGYRRILVIGGGVAFAAALGLISVSQGFIVLLIAWMVYYPASGAFVSLSQASLMDYDPTRHEQNMVRWEFAGWVGFALGPLTLAGAIAVGLGWRVAFLTMAAITLPAIIAVSRIPIGPKRNEPDLNAPSFADGIRTAIKALKRFRVVKWLALLQASDLMLATFSSFLALYMVDVSGVSESKAALTLSVWLGVSLLGNLFLIPLLERVRGLTFFASQCGRRPGAVSGISACFFVRDETDRCRTAGIRERRVVLNPSGTGLLLAARSERHNRGVGQCIRDFRLGDPVRHRRGLHQLGTRHRHVAALGGAGFTALWPHGGRDAREEKVASAAWREEGLTRRARGARSLFTSGAHPSAQKAACHSSKNSHRSTPRS